MDITHYANYAFPPLSPNKITDFLQWPLKDVSQQPDEDIHKARARAQKLLSSNTWGLAQLPVETFWSSDIETPPKGI